MTTWQSISTAPKDGTEILFLVPNLYSRPKVFVGNWDVDKYAKKPIPRWSTSDRLYSRGDALRHQPSHWMPIPVLPGWDAE